MAFKTLDRHKCALIRILAENAVREAINKKRAESSSAKPQPPALVAVRKKA